MEWTQMQRPDLVIFDCDGTLIDSERAALETSRALLAEVGLRYSPMEMRAKFAGVTLGSIERHVWVDHQVRLDYGWQDRWRQGFRERCATGIAAIPGVEQALRSLAEARIPLCVASNASHEDIVRNLGAVDLLWAFEDQIFSADAVLAGKPAPDVFRLAADTLGARPRNCVVVEDSAAGTTGALAAGMRVLGYAPDDVSDGILRSAGATTFASMAQLDSLISRTDRVQVD
jgi:HAD superfamily hydrolase (TIGR01509 family)